MRRLWPQGHCWPLLLAGAPMPLRRQNGSNEDDSYPPPPSIVPPHSLSESHFQRVKVWLWSRGDEGGVGEGLRAFAIGQRLPIRAENLAAGSCENGVTCGRIPFHGASKARVNVGLSCSNKAEFQG